VLGRTGQVPSANDDRFKMRIAGLTVSIKLTLVTPFKKIPVDSNDQATVARPHAA